MPWRPREISTAPSPHGGRSPRAEKAAGELRARAEARLAAAINEASRRLASGEFEEGLRALDAVRDAKYSAWDARVANMRTRITNAARLAKSKAVASARSAFSKHAKTFVSAASAGDFAAARKAAADARGDPLLKEIPAEAAALNEAADAIARAEEALRASLASLQGKGPCDIETEKGRVRGEVVRVADPFIHVRCEAVVGGVETKYETTIRIADLTAAEVRRHPGTFRPSTQSEHLAQALRAMALKDVAWAEAELAASGNHPLSPACRASLDDLKSRVAETAAKEAWNSLVRFAKPGKLTAAKAKQLIEKLEAFDKNHGRTSVARSVQQEILNLKDAALSAGGGWKPVPVSALQVRCQGAATSSASGDTLTVHVPHGQGNLATILLLPHARDFRLKFEYRGDLLEMFIRKVNWHGCVNILTGPSGVIVRSYPTDTPNRPVALAHDRQASLAPGQWHRAEIHAAGTAFSLSIDGIFYCKEAKVPAVARGDAYVLAWPGKAFELRGVTAAVLDRQVGSGVSEGIVTDKGPDWIELKEDGEDVPLRYEPQRGAGGAHDPQMLKTITSVITLNRAQLSWTLEKGRLKVTGIQLQKPSQQSGSIVGTITFKHGNCIEVTPLSGPPERLIPRWVGGGSTAGDGADPRMAAEISKYGVGDKVKVDWTYDNRKRLVGIEPAR